jgi:hypothetical protein
MGGGIEKIGEFLKVILNSINFEIKLCVDEIA